jgi:uncharacterized protein YqjF (DUF2071 family)
MKPFLSAEWRKLIMVNYVVPKETLKRYLPNKTELDLWNGKCYVSLVGFMFKNTRIKGIRIPFHIDFEEANLRFYVKLEDGQEEKRGVVFIKEIVRKPVVSIVANTFYKENYNTMRMENAFFEENDSLHVEYCWKNDERWNCVAVKAEGELQEIKQGSEVEYITEHYYGYTRRNESDTSVYRVEHPKWQTYRVHDYFIDVDFSNLYGNEFKFLESSDPSSIFLIEGSEVTVGRGMVL